MRPAPADLGTAARAYDAKYDLLPPAPGTQSQDSFPHLAGYGAAYYTYRWSVVIADDMFTAQQLLPLYYRRVILLADTPLLGAQLADVLAANHIKGALVVSRSTDPRTSLAPFTRVDTVQRGRFKGETWRR